MPVGASRAVLSQNVLHAAEADLVAISEHPLGCAGQELGYEQFDVRVR